MKKIYLILILAGTLLLDACEPKTKKDEDSYLQPISDRYLGQKPPGLTPIAFAPGIVSTEEYFEDGNTFSPDLKEYYFVRHGGKYEKPTSMVIRYENGNWGDEVETDIKYPVFSKDGNTIYRGNKYKVRTDSGWSEFKSMGSPFTDKIIMGITVSNSGTFFFDEFVFDEFERPDTVGAISYSRRVNGEYQPRQKLGEEINTGAWIAHPYIAPDESYLLWNVKREDGYGDSDIYVSFQENNGSWTLAINMGDKINTTHGESGPKVTPDEKYLFFWRGYERVEEDGSSFWVGSPYWVDAKVIENLRPKQ
ncbi:MAG: hypothetical protein RLN88_11040 [Ekhidna sp.]|uniref:hypothetical protein n=1 Tax=Ekhidna sp. TaxID=2608089 RepID=UPI0032EAE82C